MPSSEILRQFSGVMFFWHVAVLRAAGELLGQRRDRDAEQRREVLRGPRHPDLDADPVHGLDVRRHGGLVDRDRPAFDARGEDRAVAVGDRAAQGGSGIVAVREDWASLETAEASKPWSRSSCAPKMLKMNSTATVIVRIRRRGLDPSRLTLRPAGRRGGEPGRVGARRALMSASRAGRACGRPVVRLLTCRGLRCPRAEVGRG